MKVLVTLGWFNDPGEGGLVEIDLARCTQEVLLTYLPPPPLRVAGKGFTGAAWTGQPGSSNLLVCGYCALYHVAVDSWTIETIWHQPCWNDLHHVAVSAERIYVVNTGLESIDLYTLDGLFVGSHVLHPGWLSAARLTGYTPARADLPRLHNVHWPRDRELPSSETLIEAYYTQQADAATAPSMPSARQIPFATRKVRDYIHPNHVTIHGDRILVTRFLDRAVDDLTSFRRVISDTPGLPHDGIIDHDRLWITCVNGLAIAYAIEDGKVTGREVERIDVFATGHTGWCRGLAVTPGHIIVGLTAIRQMPRYRWCELPFEETETSVLCIERETGRLSQRVVLDDAARHPKIFSVLLM
ncbi:MAG: hypothetical protein AAGC55_08300 [Myxococcota bacterium]